MNRDENIENFFRSPLYAELRNDFELRDRVIADMLKLIKVSAKITDIETVADFIELAVKESSDYYENQSFVSLIEQCILRKQFLEQRCRTIAKL